MTDEKSRGSTGVFSRIGAKLFSVRLFVGLVFVVLAAVFVRPSQRFGPPNFWIQAVSVLLVVFGIGLRAWSAGFAGGHTRDKSISAPRLVTWGPYAMVRHPIYLGTLILGLGMVGILGVPILFLFYVIACACLYFTLIPAEESFLRKQYGAAHETYCHSVPIIFPWKFSRRNPAHENFSWRSAAGEAWIALVLMMIYAAFWILWK